jgi:hypothetical protein
MKVSLISSVRPHPSSQINGRIPRDCGCEWGGPSCLACRLLLCVDDLTPEQRVRFLELAVRRER